MGRLIDADKLKADLEKAISKNEDMDCLDFLRVASVIDAQPTAYDPDKVVEQLEERTAFLKDCTKYGNKTGLYCNKCGKWIKWLTKDEKRLFAHNNKTKMTNADRIRSMTDEELAEFIINFDNHFGEEYEGEQSCLSWLQKESEGSHDGE